MRLIHGLIKLTITASLISGGLLLYRYSVSDLYELFIDLPIPDYDLLRQNTDLFRQIGGITLAVLAFLAFLPRGLRRRSSNEVSFAGAHGEVTIQLDHVESTLEKVVGKLPEVKTIALRVRPLDGPGRVQVTASAILMKDANGDARQITARVSGYIQIHTRKILGLEDVVVRLKVRRMLVNLRSLKPEPLLLEAPQEQRNVAKTPPRAAMAEPSRGPNGGMSEADAEASWAGGESGRDDEKDD